MVFIIYPCFNNYDLLIGENSDFIKENAHRVILVDDHSVEQEKFKGQEFSRRVGCHFEVNPSKGVQSAVNFVIEKFCSNEDWVAVMQQDVKFLNPTAINHLDSLTDKINHENHKIGAFGFPNYMPDSHYHVNVANLSSLSLQNCWLGVFNLSSANNYGKRTVFFKFLKLLSVIPKIEKIERRIWQKILINRNFAPLTYPYFKEAVSEYRGLVAIELPVWTVVVISTSAWRRAIVTDNRFVFHLWFPDIAMQFMRNQYYVCLYSELIVMNNWRVKPKYNIQGSVEEGKKINGRMERYGNHLKVWSEKWGYDYENPFPPIKKLCQHGKLISHIRLNNPKFPIKKFKI